MTPSSCNSILMGGAIFRPSWRACEQLAALVVNATQPCLQPPCALGVSQPPTDQPMYALTGEHFLFPSSVRRVTCCLLYPPTLSFTLCFGHCIYEVEVSWYLYEEGKVADLLEKECSSEVSHKSLKQCNRYVADVRAGKGQVKAVKDIRRSTNLASPRIYTALELLNASQEQWAQSLSLARFESLQQCASRAI